MLQVLSQLFFPPQLSLSDELRRIRVMPIVLERAILRHNGIHALDRLVAAGSYDNSLLLRAAIRQFKYKHSRHLGEPLGHILSQAARVFVYNHRTVLCPVPLHWMRTFQRGFNQSELLADCVSDELSIALHPLLKRVRPTGHQARRSREERKTALTDVFVFNEMYAVPERVILVDDVATTMSTLDECAMELKHRGVNTVDALVLALG